MAMVQETTERSASYRFDFVNIRPPETLNSAHAFVAPDCREPAVFSRYVVGGRASVAGMERARRANRAAPHAGRSAFNSSAYLYILYNFKLGWLQV